MPRKTFLMGIFITLSIIFGYSLVHYDKIGNNYARLLGLPVWILAFIVIVGVIISGLMWRPVREPGTKGTTPNWLFWAFGGIFFLAMGLGVYFTEPVVCTARDGDVCYESDTAWNVRNREGSTYTGYYRNRWVWYVGDVIDSAVSPGYGSTYSNANNSSGTGVGDLFSDMDLEDGEAAIIVFLIILLVILAISSAFVPNLWVIVCGITLVCFFLTIVRVHRTQEDEKLNHDVVSESPLLP